jgi:flavin-dependent dehydrogenase
MGPIPDLRREGPDAVTPEVVVIGGGLAGGAAAAHLARAGHDVCVLERTTGPHEKVCGEFLSFEAQEELEMLGIDLSGLGGLPIRTLVVQSGSARLEAPLDFRGVSVSRRVLDDDLLARAGQAGAEVRRGVRVKGATRTGRGWDVQIDGGPAIRARHLFLATGKHDLRGWPRPATRHKGLVGFKAYWQLPSNRTVSDAVELHLFPGGYAGFQPASSGRANLCLVVRANDFAALGGRWDDLLGHLLRHCPGLREQLAQGTICDARPLAIAAVPYGMVLEQGREVWRLGDQAVVIPSFTGEGMSIALHSARLAASCFASGETAEQFQRRLARALAGQVRRSTAISRALVSPFAQRMIERLPFARVLPWALRRTRIPTAARVHV